MTKRDTSLEYALGILLSLVCFALYLKTLCPTTDFIDSGELTTVAYTLGIAHPTGYPIFTLIGWLFSHLPLSSSVVYRVNVMAAFLCSVSLFIFFRFMVFFIGEALGTKSTGHRMVQLLPAAVATVSLGLSETFWAQATAVEVYSLHTVFLSTLLFLFVKAIHLHSESSRIPGENRSRLWYTFALALGLSFTNHMTTILLGPGFLYLYFYTFGLNGRTWKHLLGLVPAFLLGFSLYLYLPIRASGHPLLNWGNPADLERFWWHFTGKQYRVWIFSSTESAERQLNYFFSTVGAKFAYVPVCLAIVGVWRLVRRNRPLLLFTLLLFLGCLFYSVNYDIHDIDSYFLLAFFTIALWAGVGCSVLVSFLRDRPRSNWIAYAGLALMIGIMLTNIDDVDESQSYLVEDYTKDMFKSIDSNALILSYQWDYFVSAAYYFQIVDHLRPDVVVIDKELLRRSWYYKQLEWRYPALYRGSQHEIEAFLAELYRFEHDLPYSSNVIEARYQEVIHSLFEKNYAARPIYATAEIEESYTSGFQKVPAGLAFRLYRDTLAHPYRAPSFSFRPSGRRDSYNEGILLQYARAYVNNALYMHLTGNDDMALQLLDRALALRPEMPEALSLKERITRRG